MVVYSSLYYSHFSYPYSYSIILLLTPFLYFLFFYSLDYNNDIYAQEEDKNNATRIHIIIIPKGSANPSIDITNLEERKWYNPSNLEIKSGDVVKWINNDRESHTVTSGLGSGIQSLLTNKLGTANGIFDSGLFAPGESWSYNFTDKVGIFTYFCTLHPWMTGIVDVKKSQNVEQQKENGEKGENKISSIPDYPVDGKGNKLSIFPVHTLTNDEKYDIDMSWSPKVLQTNKPSTFLIDFFENPSNKKIHLVPYNFVIIQNNETLEKTSGMTEMGADTLQYTFTEPGPITIRIDNIGNTGAYTEFNTLIYQNPNTTSSLSKAENNKENGNGGIISPVGQFSTGLISPIFLVTLVYVIIIAIPAAAAVVIVLYKKGII